MSKSSVLFCTTGSDAQIDYEELRKVQVYFLSGVYVLKAYSLVSEVKKEKTM